MKSKENLKTMTRIARDDEVKAIEKTVEEFRARKEKQIDKGIETKALITLPHPSAAVEAKRRPPFIAIQNVAS